MGLMCNGRSDRLMCNIVLRVGGADGRSGGLMCNVVLMMGGADMQTVF